MLVFAIVLIRALWRRGWEIAPIPPDCGVKGAMLRHMLKLPELLAAPAALRVAAGPGWLTTTGTVPNYFRISQK
jgi:hypothetical protein